MAWISIALAKKNDNAYVQTRLMNSIKLGDIKTNGSYADFYYEEYDGTTSKYTTSALTKDSLVALVDDSTLYADRVEISILGSSSGRKNKLGTADLYASAETINVAASRLVGAVDIDASTCYALFELGKKTILYKVDATIAELESASSTSVSIA